MTDCDGLIANLRNANNAARIDLDAIKARAAAATGGPWATQRGAPYLVYGDARNGTFICDTGYLQQSLADAEFIAAARADVPALVAEIERLTAERDRWRRVAEYGWHLHNYGENAPGGTETWREFERLIRAAADAS